MATGFPQNKHLNKFQRRRIRFCQSDPNFWMKGNEVRTCEIRDTGVALLRIYNLPNIDQQSQPIVFQRKYLLS